MAQYHMAYGCLQTLKKHESSVQAGMLLCTGSQVASSANTQDNQKCFRVCIMPILR